MKWWVGFHLQERENGGFQVEGAAGVGMGAGSVRVREGELLGVSLERENVARHERARFLDESLDKSLHAKIGVPQERCEQEKASVRLVPLKDHNSRREQGERMDDLGGKLGEK